MFNFIWIWLLVGLVAAIPLLLFTERLSPRGRIRCLGRGLVIAALVYIVFASLWGDVEWLLIESSGVLLYSVFYWFALRHNSLWLAAGWLLHPLWDVALHLFGPGQEVAPVWYAVACVSFDLVVTAYIVTRIPINATKPL